MDLTDETASERRACRTGETGRDGEGRLLTDGGQSASETEQDEGGDDDGGTAESSQSERTEKNGQEQAAENGEAVSNAVDAHGEEDYRADEGTTVLYLDLEGLFLDLLGLEVDLNEVELDVSAITGEGRLLGNLLSGVGGLLSFGEGGLLSDFLGGSLFSGLGSGDDDDEDGGLFSSLNGSGDDDGTSVTDRVSGTLSDAFSEVPFDELLTALLKELVTQFFGDDDGGEGSDASS